MITIRRKIGLERIFHIILLLIFIVNVQQWAYRQPEWYDYSNFYSPETMEELKANWKPPNYDVYFVMMWYLFAGLILLSKKDLWFFRGINLLLLYLAGWMIHLQLAWSPYNPFLIVPLTTNGSRGWTSVGWMPLAFIIGIVWFIFCGLLTWGVAGFEEDVKKRFKEFYGKEIRDDS